MTNQPEEKEWNVVLSPLAMVQLSEMSDEEFEAAKEIIAKIAKDPHNTGEPVDWEDLPDDVRQALMEEHERGPEEGHEQGR